MAESLSDVLEKTQSDAQPINWRREEWVTAWRVGQCLSDGEAASLTVWWNPNPGPCQRLTSADNQQLELNFTLKFFLQTWLLFRTFTSFPDLSAFAMWQSLPLGSFFKAKSSHS